MSTRIAVVAAIIAAQLSPGVAAAQGVCVTCKGPERGYRCTIKDSDRFQAIRGSSRAIEMLCLSQVAHAGGHETCRVDTSYVGPCIGQHLEIDLAKTAAASLPAAESPSEPSAVPGAPPPGRSGPPQTLEELARDTVAKSKEQLSEADKQVKKAGEAVGGAVQQTWECLASLFKNC